MFGAFACLCGNDYINGDILEKIHTKLNIKWKCSPATLIKNISGSIKSGELKEAQLLKTLEGPGTKSASNLLQKYRQSCAMYATDDEPSLQPEEWMRKTPECEVLADRFVVGSTHPAIFGIFQSKTNWLAIHPYNSGDSKIYAIWMPLRLQMLGMMCAAFGVYAPGTIYQEEGAMEKTKKVSPTFELAESDHGVSWTAKLSISGLLGKGEAQQQRNYFFETLCGPLAAQFRPPSFDFDDTVAVTLAALAYLLRKDSSVLSEDEVQNILLHTLCVVDDAIFAGVKSIAAEWPTRNNGSERDVHVTSMMLLGLETAAMVNHLCGSPLQIAYVRNSDKFRGLVLISLVQDRIFDGWLFQNLEELKDDICEKFPNSWLRAKGAAKFLFL